jgi:hypothetical protein
MSKGTSMPSILEVRDLVKKYGARSKESPLITRKVRSSACWDPTGEDDNHLHAVHVIHAHRGLK